MIAKLSGTIDTVSEDSVTINVNGVGYNVFVSSKLINSLNIGDIVSLVIAHIFRQEMQYLCGFLTNDERNVFKTLLDVHGIGIKSAMAVLSCLSMEEFALAVATQDSDILCRADGIGRKTASRILLELKDKTLIKIGPTTPNSINDAILGLISLGYQKSHIVNIVNKVSKELGANASTNDLIVSCLRNL